jgi:hypothetical protein
MIRCDVDATTGVLSKRQNVLEGSANKQDGNRWFFVGVFL